MAENEEELKTLLMWVEEESEKTRSKLSFQKTKVVASGHITSWQIEGEKVETVTDFIFLGSKTTADSDCSLEIKKKCLLLSKRDTDVKNKLLDYVGEDKGGMIWENSTETCILPYIKEMTSAVLQCMKQGTQSQCSWFASSSGPEAC